MSSSLGSPTLLLVPTPLELLRLQDLGSFELGHGLLKLCGFGPVAAGVRSAQLIAELRPARVLLIGIAGSYDTLLHPIGTASEFCEVALHGVGAGEGDDFKGPPALGFPQWPGSPGTTPHPVVDSLPLACDKRAELGTLLTTCAAASGEVQSTRRKERFPNAVAEDMEGFAVAMACTLSDTPLRIVRGFSNLVGDRDASRWRIPAALEAARELAHTILSSNSGWE
ncbi:MAG: futalosine hydrolase [Planctomycetota bacterium]|jgi:futalosine hydrolase